MGVIRPAGGKGSARSLFRHGQVGGSRENLKRPAEVKTIIRADEEIEYGAVVKVMGLLQAAQVTDISVAVK